MCVLSVLRWIYWRWKSQDWSCSKSGLFFKIHRQENRKDAKWITGCFLEKQHHCHIFHPLSLKVSCTNLNMVQRSAGIVNSKGKTWLKSWTDWSRMCIIYMYKLFMKCFLTFHRSWIGVQSLPKCVTAQHL